MPKSMWMIKGHVDEWDNTQMYWSNEQGWVSVDDAEIYSEDEKAANKGLPMGGKWVKVKENMR